MFVGMGISAVFPVIDGVSTYGLAQMRKQIGLIWLVLQGALYILGAGLYAVSCPLYLNARSIDLATADTTDIGEVAGTMGTWTF